MQPSGNLDVVRSLWEAVASGDDEAVFGFYDPDIAWDSHDVGPMEGPFHGHDGVRRFFRGWMESFDGYDSVPESFSAAGDCVVVAYRVIGRGKTSGVDVDMKRWNVYRIADGLITRVDIFSNEAEARAAATSST